MPAVVEDALGGITPYGTRQVWMKGCDVLKFFSRCRILSHVMTGISVVMGMLILFELLPLHDYDDRALLFLMARILLFVLSVFSVILLKCLTGTQRRIWKPSCGIVPGAASPAMRTGPGHLGDMADKQCGPLRAAPLLFMKNGRFAGGAIRPACP